MSATLFTLLELTLFFGFIVGVGIWQLRELDRDAKALKAERDVSREDEAA